MRSLLTLILLATVLSIAAEQGVGQFVGVQRRVPQDYATIQVTIDTSNNGDTVLVSEAKHKENIRYHGKAIVVGSLYVVDGDTTHMVKTIMPWGLVINESTCTNS